MQQVRVVVYGMCDDLVDRVPAFKSPIPGSNLGLGGLPTGRQIGLGILYNIKFKKNSKPWGAGKKNSKVFMATMA